MCSVRSSLVIIQSSRLQLCQRKFPGVSSHVLSVQVEESDQCCLAAKFVVQVTGFTKDEEPLACVNIMVDFRPKFPRIW